MKHLPLLSLLGLALAGTVAPAWADPLQFFNTGVDNNGNVLAAGTADSHYSLIYSADSDGTAALAMTPNGNWEGDSSTAGWIGPVADGSQSQDSGYFVYETTLDLTGYDAASAVLSGLIAADDEVYIYLNRGGNAVFSGSGFGSDTAFLINSGFVAGVNEIDFVVHNDSGPTGLKVDDTVATAQPIPEPGTLLLLATGTAFAGYHAFRKAGLRAD